MSKNKEESKAKRIVNIVVMVVEIIVIILAIVLAVSVIFGSKKTEEDLSKGYNLTVVLSDSMNGNMTKDQIKTIYSESTHPIGSFNIKDLLIVKAVSSEEDYKSLRIGDVITYIGNVNGQQALITHRIIQIDKVVDGNLYTLAYSDENNVIHKHENYEELQNADGYYNYLTLGDLQRNDDGTFEPSQGILYEESQVQGVVISVIPKVGGIIYWFLDSKHFLWSVVIPLAALLAYNLYLLVKLIISARFKKLEQQKQEEIEALKNSIMANQNPVNTEANSLEEEIKKKAIEEYLAKIAQEAVEKERAKAQVAADNTTISDTKIKDSKEDVTKQDITLEDKKQE